MTTAIRVKPNSYGQIESQIFAWNANQSVETHRSVVNRRIKSLYRILEDPKTDDLTMKVCSRDKKAGKLHLHPIDQFSILKTGQRHSQCRACRVEQSGDWCLKKKTARSKYHKEYRKTYKTPDKPKKYMRKELSDIYVAVKN